MTDPSANSTQIEVRLACTRGARIELGGFCERADRSHAICYRCLGRELRQSLVRPHAHGG
jgi:hypothetical protein